MKLFIQLIVLLFSISTNNLINASLCKKENFVWKIAGSNCGKFCTDLVAEAPSICPKWRLNIGCFCKDGYYLKKNLQCVSPEDCEEDKPKPREANTPPPMDCPDNEHYDGCSSRCLEQCEKRDDPIACPINCDQGCFCKGSRLRNAQGVCVDIPKCEPLPPKSGDQSAKQCPHGEVFNDCGDRCKEMCANVKNTLGQSKDCTKCQSGCFCMKGLQRNEKGQCVPSKMCESKNALFKMITSMINMIFKNVESDLGGGQDDSPTL